jgi:hypothetical protein
MTAQHDASKFTPKPGDLFYAKSRIRVFRGGEWVKDPAWSFSIFQCLTIDEICVNTQLVHNSNSLPLGRVRLLLRDYDLRPVGLDVAKAMGLRNEVAA